jgi:hypothetical protein
MNDDIKIIAAPPSTFVFGDGRFRVLYGPEHEGRRKVIGLIQEDQVERLEVMLEYADAHMTEDDR